MPLPAVNSLYSKIDNKTGETIDPLLEGASFHLESISSFGCATDEGFWYDQEQPEWVALVRGTATIDFEEGPINLRSGDFITIAAHQKHRVSKVSANAVWVALHYKT